MSPSWSSLVLLLALLVPLTFALAALFTPVRGALRQASAASVLAVVLAVAVAVGIALVPAPSLPGSGLRRLVRLDVVTAVMLGLVCAIAAVIARYSQSYLRGDPGAPRYARALSATLAAVTTLVLANHLAVIAAAWVATSLALHQLLTFFPERTPALVAAHKKFLLSRLADACMLTALALVGLAVGSLHLDDVHAWARSHHELPLPVHVGAVLLVLAVALKSAQLPFHGWLTQVMEAPTPVSALLHAGVVNIGGFLMIRLAPLMAQAPVAQALLVIIGTTTAVVAALVMSTRVSVKVALAWSTCAQMGFMLVQCGLGAWHLALLHLVAHSLYKAHAFLSSGSAVEAWRVQALAPRREVVPLRWMVVAAVVAVLGVVAVGVGAEAVVGAERDPSTWPLALVLALSLAPLVARAVGSGSRPLVLVVLAGVGVGLLFAGWHALAGQLLARPVAPSSAVLGWLVVVPGFVLLFALQAVMQAYPAGRLARVLRPRLFAGFYLDEIFTRLTFRLWPPRLPSPKASPRPLPITNAVET